MKSLRPLLFTLGLCLLPAMASADPQTARDALKRSCTSDYLEHCGEHPPGGPEVEACFKLNMKKLSPDCSSAILTYKREQKAANRLSLSH